MKINKLLTVAALATLLLGGCKDEFLETLPSDQVAEGEVFQTTQGAYVALDGTFRYMYANTPSGGGTGHGFFGQKAVDLTLDLMGEDMAVHSPGYGWFNTEYNYTSFRTNLDGGRSHWTWEYYYSMINNANRIIARIDDAVGPEEEKNNVKGQALALRAYAYFYLTNIYQHTYVGNENAPAVPLYTEPTMEGKGRATVQEVYSQVTADLDEAIRLLDGTGKVHVSHIDQQVAQGIRARVALQMEDWATAATMANAARQGKNPMSADEYLAGFGKPNNEWMWGFQIITDQSTIYASLFSHIDPFAGGYATLGTQKEISDWLYDQMDDNDIRKQAFIAPVEEEEAPLVNYASVKFYTPQRGSWAADYLMMRAGEMYLIEAEALARQGDNDGQAQDLLNELIGARDADYETSLTGQALIDEILLQRRIELWGEGFRLLDIKRLKLPLDRTHATNHLPSLAGELSIPAEDAKFLFRIPQSEIDANENISMSDQNP